MKTKWRDFPSGIEIFKVLKAELDVIAEDNDSRQSELIDDIFPNEGDDLPQEIVACDLDFIYLIN